MVAPAIKPRPPSDASESAPRVSFRQALAFWTKLGFISFGGPAGQIAIMHRELVERRRWLSEETFLHALSFCTFLPGPEAQQLATYCGWRLHGARGGIAAGALFVIPSALLLALLSWIYAEHGSVDAVAAAFAGLKPAVIAIVAHAVVRIGKRALRGPALVLLAAAAFAALYVFHLPFPLVVAGAGLIGLVGSRYAPSSFPPPASHGGPAASAAADRLHAGGARAGGARALRVVAICGGLWLAPVIAVGAWQGWDSVFVDQARFFSQAALVTFGGAYAVLPYVGQAAVERYGWLGPGEMLDGLGLAETTPGPLIMVVQFVGYLGAWRQPGDLAPWQAGLLGSFITTWVTFLPCFLMIFLGAPHVEGLRERPALASALSAITAAVVGVVLNLAVWFAAHALVPPGGPVDWIGIGVAVAILAGLSKWNWGVVPVVLGGAALGLLRAWLA